MKWAFHFHTFFRIRFLFFSPTKQTNKIFYIIFHLRLGWHRSCSSLPEHTIRRTAAKSLISNEKKNDQQMRLFVFTFYVFEEVRKGICTFLLRFIVDSSALLFRVFKFWCKHKLSHDEWIPFKSSTGVDCEIYGISTEENKNKALGDSLADAYLIQVCNK